MKTRIIVVSIHQQDMQITCTSTQITHFDQAVILFFKCALNNANATNV